ncbi:PepSY-associated TM helix domain-containing protein [Methylococcus sp. EFPC2]|uniref:PepSY-associated TM helix domain-containing protein n=1 Tax=Methylococcus sp. EFPC2 TaxID=2812648 RepID=UPI001966D6BD|nr:PepSY-associated TM helix domain-containing protein [Methylococcus sp. EFPC2]QSA96562.1 PepSY domain-containing protein [Methylococcus sp. EFPC2]
MKGLNEDTLSLGGAPAEIRDARLSTLKARRRLWLDVHLWLGLMLGFFLAVFALTGSILVVHAEIDEWLNPKLLRVAHAEGAVYRPLAEIFEAGRAAMPAQAKPTFVTYPRNDKAAFRLNYMLAAEQGVTQGWQVAVDPYTARVTGKQLLGSPDSWLPTR